MVYNGTELTTSEVGRISRSRIANLSYLQNEINAATMPDQSYWPWVEAFLTKLWLPGPEKIGIHSDTQLLIHAMNTPEGRPLVFIREFFAMPYKVRHCLAISAFILCLWIIDLAFRLIS